MDEDGYFGDAVAARYDVVHGARGQLDETIAVLADLAGAGRALEFAIGTGRIGLPLSRAGVPVAGIEMSRAMVSEMRRKPGAERIEVAIGDMAKVRVDGAFSLVYLVYNTIDNLTTQDAQVACFQNAAQHLAPGGSFVVETLVPPLQRLPEGETLLAFARDDTHWGIDEFDVVTQTYTSHHAHFGAEAGVQNAVPFRYAWPAELDLMARLAGLTPAHRWADWSRTPFTAASRQHVSVWRKPL